MTKDEIKSENELIAKFMGFGLNQFGEVDNLDIYLQWMATNVNCVYDIQHDDFPLLDRNDYWKFHSSWDWLIPVVEKIESLGHPVYITSNNCIIYEHTGKDHGWNIDSYSSSKIESCWLACVHFVEKLINNKK